MKILKFERPNTGAEAIIMISGTLVILKERYESDKTFETVKKAFQNLITRSFSPINLTLEDAKEYNLI
jgi:archaellum component FlaF (FlaF/FlaG flagellin family)